MTAVTLDEASSEKLRECRQVAVLRDPQGNIVGYFQPSHMRALLEGDIPDFDEEELDRREARHDVISSTEVRRRLGISQ